MRDEIRNAGEFMKDLREVIKGFYSGACSAATDKDMGRASVVGGCTKEFLLSLGFDEKAIDDAWEYLPRTRGSVPDRREIKRRETMNNPPAPQPLPLRHYGE